LNIETFGDSNATYVPLFGLRNLIQEYTASANNLSRLPVNRGLGQAKSLISSANLQKSRFTRAAGCCPNRQVGKTLGERVMTKAFLTTDAPGEGLPLWALI
jgi:hypothetical protein